MKRFLQRRGRPRRNKGSLLVAAVFFWFLLAALFAHFTQLARLAVERVRLQNSADAIAYSLAQIQARSLNAVAQLNQGLALLTRSAAAIYATYLALLAAASFFGAGSTALIEYQRLAWPTLDKLQALAKAMAALQEQIAAATPGLCLAEGERLRRANGGTRLVVYPPPLEDGGAVPAMRLWIQRPDQPRRIGQWEFPALLKLAAEFPRRQKVASAVLAPFPAKLLPWERGGQSCAQAQAAVRGRDLSRDDFQAALEPLTWQRALNTLILARNLAAGADTAAALFQTSAWIRH